VPLQEQVGELSGLLAAVDDVTKPGDRIFVGPSDLSNTEYNDTFLYHLVPDLIPASYFMEMNPGTADRPGSRLLSDVSTADVIIRTTRFDDWTGSRSVPSQGPPSIIPNMFCAGPTFGPWELLVRCNRETSQENR
jgi:hypothetical protein